MDERDTDTGLEKSVVDWVIDCPAAEPIFRQYQIDYYCPGKSLETACRERGLDPRMILAAILDAHGK